jgi:hypothetical protein
MISFKTLALYALANEIQTPWTQYVKNTTGEAFIISFMGGPLWIGTEGMIEHF